MHIESVRMIASAWQLSCSNPAKVASLRVALSCERAFFQTRCTAQAFERLHEAGRMTQSFKKISPTTASTTSKRQLLRWHDEAITAFGPLDDVDKTGPTRSCWAICRETVRNIHGPGNFLAHGQLSVPRDAR